MRINKILAIGTYETLESYDRTDDYIKIMKTDTLHHLRRDLATAFQNKSTDVFEIRLSDYNEKVKLAKNKLLRTLSKRQKKYFGFDMVEAFNQYSMFVCGEEATGKPTIGMLEGMACGCVYIGRDDVDYSSIGMTNGVHYLSYDGTIGGLINCFNENLNNTQKLDKIRKNGTDFVRKKFTAEIEFQRLLANL